MSTTKGGQISLLFCNVGGFSGPFVYLGRLGSVVWTKMGHKFHKAPSLPANPTTACKDSELPAHSSTVIENCQLLDTKPPPPRRLRHENDEDTLFLYHALLDHNPKLNGESEFLLHTQANEQVSRALSKTLARSGSFRDVKLSISAGSPLQQMKEKREASSNGLPRLRLRHMSPLSTSVVRFY